MLPRTMTLAVVVGLCAGVCALTPVFSAQGESSALIPAGASLPGGPRVITSPLLQIKVSGADRERLLAWAAWAEQSVQPVIRLMNSTPRAVSHRVLCIELGAPQSSSPSVSTSRWVMAGGRVGQTLRLEGWENLPRNEVQEWLVHLTLNESLIDRQTAGARKDQPRDVPRWLAVGIARHLDFEQRARDGHQVVDIVAVKQAPSLTDLMSWSHLPGGGAPEKAFCTIAVGWILSRSSGEEGLHQLFDDMAEGKALTPDLLLQPLKFSTRSAAERDWIQWVKRQERIVRLGADTSPSAQIRKMRDYLEIAPEDIQKVNGPPGEIGHGDDLINNRSAPWAKALAAYKAEKLQQFSIGKDRDFREPLTAWIHWYKRLATSGWWPPAFLLRRQHRHCEAVQAAFESRLQKREKWVDAVEKGRESPSARPESFSEHLLEKSTLHDYVDRVESTVTTKVQNNSMRAGE